jgi:hypothetical protein
METQRVQTYKCFTCGATKTKTQHPAMDDRQFFEQLPSRVVCGWKGCNDDCYPHMGPLNGTGDGRY